MVVNGKVAHAEKRPTQAGEPPREGDSSSGVEESRFCPLGLCDSDAIPGHLLLTEIPGHLLLTEIPGHLLLTEIPVSCSTAPPVSTSPTVLTTQAKIAPELADVAIFSYF